MARLCHFPAIYETRSMSRFYGIIIVLCGVSAIVIIGSRAVGSHQSPSSFALLFTTPDGSACPTPCLFGIQPDITTYDDAVELLRLHPLTGHLQLGRGPTFTGGGIQVLLAEDDDGKVTQIHVQLR